MPVRNVDAAFRFQSTLPRRERRQRRIRTSSHSTFQSTLPRRERLISRIWFKRISRFQSTLPRRERRCLRIDTNSFNYFNPRSREGSDTESNAGLQYDRISIHAPAKGATTASVELSDNSIISIHAPAKGATIAFQSYNSRVCISIHAPAKGATVIYDKSMR